MRPRWLASAFIPALRTLSGVLGISQRDAGVHDWHLELVGQPTLGPDTNPLFHYPAGASNTAASSLVYVATQKNVLAAIDPKSGAVVWRQIFSDAQPILQYTVHEDAILARTGPAGSQAHLFSATSGHSKWSLELHPSEEGLLPEPASTAADTVFYQVSGSDATAGFDVLCLSNGHTLSRINGMNGQTVWSWSIDEPTAPTMQMHKILPPVPGANTFQILLLRRLPGGYTLMTSMLSRTGEVLQKPTAIKGANFEALENLLVFGPLPGTVESRAVYVDKSGDIRTLFFFTTGDQGPIQGMFRGQAKYVSLQSVGLEEKGIFVGTKVDGKSSILQLGSDGQVHVLHEYRDAVENGSFSGFTDREGISHVSRYSISAVLGLARMATYTFEKTEHNDAGTIFDSTFPYEPRKYGQIKHVTAEVAPRKSSNLLFRLCITTASGSFQGWLGGGMQWSREEGLAHLSYTDGEPSITFLEQPATTRIAAASMLVPSFDAIKVLLLKPLQAMNIAAPPREVSTLLGRDWLGDAFGYKKLAIVGTETGKIYALDLGNGGNIVWQSYLVPLSEKSGDVSITWKKLAVFDKRADGNILLVAIAEILSNKNQVRIQAFYLDGLTGKSFVRSESEATLLDQHIEEVLVNHGSFEPAFFLISESHELVYEKSPPPSIMSPLAGLTSTPHITYSGVSASHALKGWHALLSSGNNPVKAEEAWQYPLPDGSRIASMAKQTNGKLASIGRVLGDRSTLYKYINPHLLAVATVQDSTNTVAVHLIDGITGRAIWTAQHVGEVEAKDAVSVTLTENWLVYSFSEKGLEGKQTKMISVELFEDMTPEIKASTSFSSYSKHQPYGIAKAFIFPGKITSMTTSQTKHGVTSKALLVSTSADQIVAIPRRYLDPRRPMQQKPTTSEMAEGLIPYDPVIPVDAKWVITHRYRVAGIRGILTSPTILESTGQILAYGLDLFGGSVSPSGRFDVLSRDFNKLQLIGTTLGLAAAIGVLRPIVQRKKLKERWYPST